jgi:hypothetical protein
MEISLRPVRPVHLPVSSRDHGSISPGNRTTAAGESTATETGRTHRQCAARFVLRKSRGRRNVIHVPSNRCCGRAARAHRPALADTGVDPVVTGAVVLGVVVLGGLVLFAARRRQNG